MAALFGQEARSDLLSARNCLILLHEAERALIYGAIAIVPDIEDGASADEGALAGWAAACGHIRGYKWKVIDPEAEDFLDMPFVPTPTDDNPGMTIQELDGKALHFRPESTVRPSVDYMYFFFVLSILKMAGRNHIDRDNRSRIEDIDSLRLLVGKKAWTAESQYLHRAMVEALGLKEELGSANDDENKYKQEVALLAIIRTFEIQKTRFEEECELDLGEGEDDVADVDEDGYDYWDVVEEAPSNLELQDWEDIEEYDVDEDAS